MKYFYSQTMAAVVVHFALNLLEQGFLLLDHISWVRRFFDFLITFLRSMLNLPFLWKNFVRIIPLTNAWVFFTTLGFLNV